MNKIAAAILLAGLIAMVAGTVTHGLYFGLEHPGAADEMKRGYTIAGAETFEEGAAAIADAEPEAPVDIMALLAAAEAAAGEKTAKKCLSCHTFDKGGAHKVGPNLYGVAGASKAHRSDFTYSDAMKAVGGSWDPQALSDYLANPRAAIPGNKMAFAGIKKPEERAALIRYLQTLR